MTINIDQDHYHASPEMVAFVEKKVGKLEHFFERIVQADVILKQVSDQGLNKYVAEARLNVPNDTLFAKSSDESMEAAIDDTVRALERQIKKYKDKMRSY